MVIEGSLEVKLPTIWTDGKAEVGRSEKRRREERRSEKRKSQKKEDAGARKGRKVTKHTGAKHISKSKCTKHTMFGPLLEVEMSKKCVQLWREAHFQVKMYKAHQLRTIFGSWDVEKAHAVVAEAHFEVNMLKTLHVRTTFGRLDVVSRGRCKGFCTWSKVSETWGFCGISKNDGRCGAFEEDLERCILRGRRSTRHMFIRDVRRSECWFPENGCILEHQIFSFGKMILRDRCSTSYDLASLFRGRRSTLDRWSGKIAKAGPSALHSTFHFWTKSRAIVSFLLLSTSKIAEVSQNCFVFDVVNFENCGSLAELFRFWCCQAQKLRKSRRIVSFSNLQTDR